MNIKEITYSNRNDFKAIFVCPLCKHEFEAWGYSDANYYNNVMPNAICPKCGKNSHGEVDEIRGDTVIIHNSHGYFGTALGEVEEQAKYYEALEKANEEGYKMGLNDAWKFAAKIETMTCGEVRDIFGIEEDNSAWLCNQISYDDALQKYRKWKECYDWHDIKADDMTLEQARTAVKELRARLGIRLNNKECKE